MLWAPFLAIVGANLDLCESGWKFGFGQASSYSTRESNLPGGNSDRPTVLGSG
jgi:hypothetical protein